MVPNLGCHGTWGNSSVHFNQYLLTGSTETKTKTNEEDTVGVLDALHLDERGS